MSGSLSLSTAESVHGYLMKLKDTPRFSWLLSKYTRRWFVVDFLSSCVYYTKKESQCTVRGLVVFVDVLSYSAEVPKKYPGTCRFQIQLNTKQRTYTLFCPTYEEFQVWTQAFERILMLNAGTESICTEAAEEAFTEIERLGVDVFLCDTPNLSHHHRRSVEVSESTISNSRDHSHLNQTSPLRRH